jgi:transposase
MARPTKYTPETAKKIVDAIRVGATFNLACAYGGISEDTFANWRQRYSDFADAVKEAEGVAAVKWLAVIDKAAQEGAWQAAAWKLERKYPQQYGRRVINSFEDFNPDKIPDMTDDELDALYSKLVPSRRG